VTAVLILKAKAHDPNSMGYKCAQMLKKYLEMAKLKLHRDAAPFHYTDFKTWLPAGWQITEDTSSSSLIVKLCRPSKLRPL
jgi:hypothetical protein